jgi:hypothetical protein
MSDEDVSKAQSEDLVVETDGDGMTIEIDPESELGKRVAWHAGHNAEDPDEFLKEAVREQLDDDEVSR